MNKQKLLLIVVIFLVGLNLVQLIFILFKIEAKVPVTASPREIVIEKLSFDSMQICQYDSLIAQHKQRILRANRRIEQLKNELYQSLETGSTKIKDSLINEITDVRWRIENTNYDHFYAIKQICDSSQQQKFNDLAHELNAIFTLYQKKQAEAKD